MINKIFSKRAISPVVATALLIVVAVVSVVGFQTWFGSFSSGVFSNTETQSQTSVGNTQIDSVIGNSVYFENSGTENITVTQVKIDGVDCNISTNMTSGISELDVSSCLENVTTQTPEVVIYTNEGIYSEKFYLKEPVVAVESNSTPSVFSGNLEWSRTYDGQYLASIGEAYAKGVKVDGSGNVYVVGNTYDGVTLTNYYTVKYDSSGNELWNVTYDDGNDNAANAIDLDVSDNVYVTGESNGNYYTIKYDTNGNELWNAVSNIGGGYAIAVDSSNDVLYVTGIKNGDFHTIKYNSTNGDEILNITTNRGGGDIAYGIDVDTSGNIYVTGTSEAEDFSSYDYLTIKYNGTNGNEIWNATYDLGFDDEARAIVIDSSNNVYITGFVYDNLLSNNYFTIKYNSSGNEVWNVTYASDNNDQAYGISLDTNNDVYVTGNIINDSTLDYFTIKYDGINGNELLNITYNSGSDDGANGITIDGSDNLYITGYSYEGGSFGNFYTMKYDSSQNLLWAESFNLYELTSAFDLGNGIAIDGSGNVYVAGVSTDASTSGNFYTIKYDSSGNELWNVTYNSGLAQEDVVNAITLDGSGNIYLTGYGDEISGRNYITVKYDSSGNELWYKSYDGGLGEDMSKDLAVDGSGNVYVTGNVNSAPNHDYYTIKYDTNGNELWNVTYDSGFTDIPYGITLDGSNNVYVAGYSSGDSYAIYSIIKYDINGNHLWNITQSGEGTLDFNIVDIITDGSDNVYVTGGLEGDYFTIKYDSNGNELWNVTYDGGAGEYATGIAVDSSDDVYVTGSNGAWPSTDFYTIKYNGTSGVEIWNLTYDSGDQDSASEIVVSSTGDVFITGTTGTWPISNYLTIKYS